MQISHEILEVPNKTGQVYYAYDSESEWSVLIQLEKGNAVLNSRFKMVFISPLAFTTLDFINLTQLQFKYANIDLL